MTPHPLWSEDLLSAEYLASVIDNVAHPIFVKDRQFRFVLVNRAFCEMMGCERSEVLGKKDYDFFPPDQSDFFREKDTEMFETGKAVFIEEEPLTVGAQAERTLSTSKVPLHDAQGRVTHLVGIINDITRNKVIEDTLRLANDELELRVRERTAALQAAQEELLRKERLAVLGRLSGGLAHQIRNPLGAITNAAFLLRRAVRAHHDPNASAAVEIILEEALRANRIITDLLDYARVRPPRAAPTLFRDIVKQVLDANPLPRDVKLSLSISEGAMLAVDPEQVRGALDNIVQNAVDAMDGNGALTLTGREEGGALVVLVSDTGPGIANEVEDRLFEPLVTTKTAGLGLGLVTARLLIENQGGSIRAVPSEVGATFEIRLPLYVGATPG